MAEEAQATPAAQELGLSSASSVGVIGWLGFILLNFAAWGFISIASAITWVFGFIFCVVYTIGLVAGSLWLEKRDKEKFRQFLNLLWVLACSFLFVTGMFIAIQVIGSLDKDSPFIGSGGGGGSDWNSNQYRGGLRELLPDGATADLKAWADLDPWVSSQDSSFTFFNDRLYFTADIADSGNNNGNQLSDVLSYVANSSSVAEVSPSLRNPKFFSQLDSKLFFLADDPEYSNGVWRIEPGSPGDAAEAISRADLPLPATNQNGNIFRQLYADGGSNALYIKGEYNCGICNFYVWTIFRSGSGGSASGLTDLRGDVCSSCGGGTGGGSGNSTSNETGGGGGGIGFRDSKPTASLWGALLVAVLPMMVLAGALVKVKKLPGPFVNLYFGFEGAVVLLYLILGPAQPDDLPQFLKWFLTIYNSLFWVAIAVWSLRRPTPSPWQDELKSWAVVFVGVSFFVIIHIDLEIPYRQDAWRWIVYALLTVVQLVLSAIVSRTVPMVTGAAGLFVLSWKVAWELVELSGIPDGEFKMLALMAIIALEATGIVGGAIWYAANRERLDAMVRAALNLNFAKVRELTKMEEMSEVP